MAKKVQIVFMDSVLSRRTQFNRHLSERFDVKLLTKTSDVLSTIKALRPQVVIFSLRQTSTHGLKLCSEVREALPKGDRTILVVYGKKPRSLSQTRKELEEKFGVNAFIPFNIEYPQLEAALLSELESRSRLLHKAEIKQRQAEKLAVEAGQKGESGEVASSASWKQLLKSDISSTNLKALFTKPIMPRGKAQSN